MGGEDREPRGLLHVEGMGAKAGAVPWAGGSANVTCDWPMASWGMVTLGHP